VTRRIRASVVVATRNRPLELQACLETISRAAGPDDEIIVVDSASADGEAVCSIAASSGARYIRTESVGSAKARNLGIGCARGEVVAFTDDDARVEEGWIDALLAGFEDPAVGAVVGPVFELGGIPSALLYSYPTFDVAGDASRFSREDPGWFARVRFGAIGSGANMAVRRDLFGSHGLFKEGLGCGAPIGGDETYFLLTLVERGETVLNAPGAKVYHPRQSTGRNRELVRRRLAYLLYVFISRPGLRPLLISELFKRSSKHGRPTKTGARDSGIDLLLDLACAPPRVLAALYRDFTADRQPLLNEVASVSRGDGQSLRD
jgi:GT2 family glycosyltransferase